MKEAEDTDTSSASFFMDIIEELQSNAVFCGLDILYFWDLTIAEVLLYIEQYNKRKEVELQEKAYLIYKDAELSGLSAGINHPMVDKEIEFPPIEDVFPALFLNEETKKLREAQKRKAEILKTKAYLLKYADAHNRKFNKGGE